MLHSGCRDLSNKIRHVLWTLEVLVGRFCTELGKLFLCFQSKLTICWLTLWKNKCISKKSSRHHGRYFLRSISLSHKLPISIHFLYSVIILMSKYCSFDCYSLWQREDNGGCHHFPHILFVIPTGRWMFCLTMTLVLMVNPQQHLFLDTDRDNTEVSLSVSHQQNIKWLIM